MSQPPSLGEFEQVVLLAILRLGENAYGVTIRVEIADCIGRKPAPGALYTTLDRMQSKGLVQSRWGDPTPQRGGRAKRYFTATKKGRVAVTSAQRSYQSLLQGLGLFGREWLEYFGGVGDRPPYRPKTSRFYCRRSPRSGNGTRNVVVLVVACRNRLVTHLASRSCFCGSVFLLFLTSRAPNAGLCGAPRFASVASACRDLGAVFCGSRQTWHAFVGGCTICRRPLWIPLNGFAQLAMALCVPITTAIFYWWIPGIVVTCMALSLSILVSSVVFKRRHSSLLALALALVLGYFGVQLTLYVAEWYLGM